MAEKTAKLWAVVPAAGIGTRMGTGLPKQYLPLAQTTVIEKTLERLLRIDDLKGVAVSIHPQDKHWCKLAVSKNPKVLVVSGGAQRSDSVLNGLLAIDKQCDNDDWVLVHDAARPCVTEADIRLLIDSLAEHPVGGILGVPLSDTVKRVKPGVLSKPDVPSKTDLLAETQEQGKQVTCSSHIIEATLDRRTLWRAQTPQMYRYHILLRALQLARENNVNPTDEAAAVEYLGCESLMVEGRSDNIKITHPQDLPLAEFILQQQAR